MRARAGRRLFLVVTLACLAAVPLPGDVRNTQAAAKRAADAKRDADKAVREAERKVADLEKRLADLRKKLEQAERAGVGAAAVPAPPDRGAMEARLGELERELALLTSIINKLSNDLGLDAAEQQCLRRLIGTSIPVKAELLEILKQRREELQREIEALKADLARPAPPPPKPAAAGFDPGALRGEIEQAEKDLEAAKKALDERRAGAAEAARLKDLADLELEAARLREQKARLEERLRQKAEQARRAAEKLDEERRKASSGSEAAQSMAKVLEWTREVVTKLGEILAGDIGEAIASAATTQLEVGAAALAALPALVPGVEGLTRNPDGTYSFNRSGQTPLIPLVDALNAFVKAQAELDAAARAYAENQRKLQEADRNLAAARAAG